MLDTLQESPGLLTDCCAAFPAGVRVIEVSQQDQSL